jgi:nucleoside-diphosphate-sugar epimerase
MIKWIIENLATAEIEDVNAQEYSVVDVRDLVDKEGNSDQAILERIDTVVDLLKQNHKVVVCCDYGISRSNAIAIGAIVKYLDYDFDEAVKFVMEETGEKAIHIDVLNSVRHVLGINKRGNMPTNIKRMLITGGTGFVGSTLAARLKGNYDLITPSRQEINLLDGSIELDLLVKNNGVDTIIHLANPRKYTTTESMGQSLVMLKNVLDVCKGNHLNLLYLSSWVVYSGYNSSHLIASESLPLRPKGTYGQTKALCETLLNEYRDAYDINIYLLRLSPVYGVGSDKPKFIYNFFQKALNNETVFTHKYLNGQPALDLIHIDDAVRAIECLIKAKPDGSFDLNIGSGVGYSTFDIAKIIKEMCDSNSVIMHHEINDFVANIVMDINKAARVFGWRPTINIKDGLKEVMHHIIEIRTNASGQYHRGNVSG